MPGRFDKIENSSSFEVRSGDQKVAAQLVVNGSSAGRQRPDDDCGSSLVSLSCGGHEHAPATGDMVLLCCTLVLDWAVPSGVSPGIHRSGSATGHGGGGPSERGDHEQVISRTVTPLSILAAGCRCKGASREGSAGPRSRNQATTFSAEVAEQGIRRPSGET